MGIAKCMCGVPASHTPPYDRRCCDRREKIGSMIFNTSSVIILSNGRMRHRSIAAFYEVCRHVEIEVVGV